MALFVCFIACYLTSESSRQDICDWSPIQFLPMQHCLNWVELFTPSFARVCEGSCINGSIPRKGQNSERAILIEPVVLGRSELLRVRRFLRISSISLAGFVLTRSSTHLGLSLRIFIITFIRFRPAIFSISERNLYYFSFRTDNCLV